MKAMRFIQMILLAVAAWSCSRQDERLGRADRLVCADPEGALCMLDSIDAEGLSDGDRAWFGLLRAKALTKNHEAIGNDPLIGFAAEYFAGRGDSLETQALYYHGVGLADADSVSPAIVTLHDAYDKAVKTGDHFYAALAARSSGEVFNSQMIPDRQLIWSKRAKEQFAAAGKPVHAAWMDLDIADALIYAGRYEEAENVLDALDREEYESSMAFRKRALRHRMALYALTDRHDKITEIFDSIRLHDIPIRAFDYYNLAESYLKSGDRVRASEYRDSVAARATTRKDSLCMYHLDSRLMIDRANEEAMKAISSLIDEIMKIDETAVMHPETLILADNYSLKADLAAEKAEKERERKIWLSIMFGIIIAWGTIDMRRRLLRRRREAARLRDDLSRSESRAETLESDLEKLKGQIAEYSRRLEQKETEIGAINREKGAIEEAMRGAEEQYTARIKGLEDEYEALEKDFDTVKTSSNDLGSRIEEIVIEKEELERTFNSQEADYLRKIESLERSRGEIERERDELRQTCENMAFLERMITGINEGNLPEWIRERIRCIYDPNVILLTTVYEISKNDIEANRERVLTMAEKAISIFKDRNFVGEYVKGVDLMNNNWLTKTKEYLKNKGLIMKDAENDLMNYLYMGLPSELIGRLMNKKHTQNVNTAKSKFRKRLIQIAPELRNEFYRYLNMRNGE